MSNQMPVITIQCDWQDVIRLPKGEVWISSKILNEPGIHDKLQTTVSDGKVKLNFSDNYRYISYGPWSLVVKHIPSDLKVVFVAPSNVHKVHKKGVLSVAVSNHSLAVSSCEEDKLLVWDSRTSEVSLDLKGHGGSIYRSRFFPSGIVVLSAGADGSCRIWSAESGINPVTLKGHAMAVTDICMIEKGRNVVSVSKDGSAKLWDVGESNCLANIVEGHGQINCCAITTTSDVAEVDNEREVGTNDKLLVVGCESGLVVGAHVARRGQTFAKQLDSACNSIIVMEESVVVGCSDGKITQLNLQNGSVMNEWHESASPVQSMAVLSNHTYIVGRQDGTCTVYSLQDKFSKLRVQLTGSDCDGIRDISFNGKWVFTGCRDCKVRQYDNNQINVHFK
ncbi:unnamed protein product [Chrysodeixis includens]|uniref:Proteasomal ATPase-associated factor 1 n=1 Tax=Chrysodeixis includens TaxID=689277 RepID=A0A9P0BWX7_CHRIL|nr:unnamed protein product [Chrysodeixis includens]